MMINDRENRQILAWSYGDFMKYDKKVDFDIIEIKSSSFIKEDFFMICTDGIKYACTDKYTSIIFKDTMYEK
jgi:hypothetical protein